MCMQISNPLLAPRKIASRIVWTRLGCYPSEWTPTKAQPSAISDTGYTPHVTNLYKSYLCSMNARMVMVSEIDICQPINTSDEHF